MANVFASFRSDMGLSLSVVNEEKNRRVVAAAKKADVEAAELECSLAKAIR